MKCPLFRGGLGARYLPGGRYELLPDGRPGANDEDSRIDFACDGEEDYVATSSGTRQDHLPTDAEPAWMYRGYDELLDRRIVMLSPKRVPLQDRLPLAFSTVGRTAPAASQRAAAHEKFAASSVLPVPL